MSSWGVSVLDYGGLIVAAADYHQTPSSLVWYTCNEGLSWTTYDFTQQLTVYGVITEPGEMTTVATLYGWESGNSGWISVQINFTNIFGRKCIASDYYNWEPYDEVSRPRPSCILLAISNSCNRSGVWLHTRVIGLVNYGDQLQLQPPSDGVLGVIQCQIV